MYELLKELAERPEPFSRYTAKELWTRPHLARQMLKFHLDQHTDLASRRLETVEQVVNWIDLQLGLPGKLLCDLGCGPGLYTQRFADGGAVVTGVDFSEHSLAYARRQADERGLDIRYVSADYLEDPLPNGFDIVTLIYTDYCVLSPAQRSQLLARIRDMLNPGGSLVMDAAGVGSFTPKQEATAIEKNLMGGFWAESEYVGIQRTFVYPQELLSLDHYVIAEETETWEIFNWFQHFTTDALRTELNEVGFTVDQVAGDLTGAALKTDGELIGIIASID